MANFENFKSYSGKWDVFANEPCVFEIHCTKSPIDTNCVPFCIQQMLMLSSTEENKLILGFDEELANKIEEIFYSNAYQSFEPIESQISADQYAFLIEKFKSLNQYQLNYLTKGKAERDAVIKLIRDLSSGNISGATQNDYDTVIF